MKKTDIEILQEIAAHGRGEYKPKRAKKLFDDVMRDVVRLSAGWTCARCHTEYDPNVKEHRQAFHHTHIMPRGHHSTRWLFRNGLAHCYGCHIWFDRIQHMRIKMILKDDYSEPQMLYLIGMGYSKDELLKLALLAKQTWDGNYNAIATQLLSYIDTL